MSIPSSEHTDSQVVPRLEICGTVSESRMENVKMWSMKGLAAAVRQLSVITHEYDEYFYLTLPPKQPYEVRHDVGES
jgi:hypothetical protein